MENQQSQSPAPQQAPTKKEWYKNWWGVLIVIFFLPFFIVWYIWAKSKLSQSWKIVITVIIGILFISAIVREPKPTTTTTPLNGNNQTNTAPTVIAVQKIIYNIPSLIDKNIEEIRATLGDPQSVDEPTQQQKDLGVDIGTMDYEKDGQALSITYNANTRAITDFFLAGSDKNTLLALGDLKDSNDAYIIKTVQQINDSSKITGIQVAKKLPLELDGAVDYNTIAFQISNHEDYSWFNCNMKLNDKYKYEKNTSINAQDKITIPFSDFTTSDGTRFNFITQEAQNLFITCDTNLNRDRYNYFTIK